MFDQVMDTFRKATESTLQLQQQALQQWTQFWTQTPAVVPSPAAAPAAEQIHTFQKQIGANLAELLKKHRETLDAQYAAGIRTIEEAFRLGDAKDPAQYFRLAEEFWKHSFDCLKAMAEEQMKGFQSATQTWLESVSKGGQ